MLLTMAQFRDLARDGGQPDCAGIVRAGMAVSVDETRRAIRYCYSDNSVDRYGDTIDAQGWDLAAYLANPVALWAHDSCSPPVGRGANVAVEGNRLMGDIEYADPEIYGFADTIYRLCLGGYVNAVSVGFIPLEWTFVNDTDRPWGIDFKRQELLEISACPVPANPNALAEALTKGINLAPLREWAERVLDGENLIALPRSEVEVLRLAAGATPRYWLHSPGKLTKPQADRAVAAVKEWQEDPTRVLVLDAGMELRCDRLLLSASPSATERAGRVLSSANEADLRQAAGLIEGVLAQVDPAEETVETGAALDDPCDPDNPDYDPDNPECEDQARRTRIARLARLQFDTAA